MDIQKDVCANCPTKCIEWDGKALTIDNSNCVKCMHCINAMPKALRPGVDTGATILLGSKAPIVQGAQLSSVLVPFMKLEPPYEELKDLTERIWDFWSEHGKNRERVGELIQRVGLGNFLEAIGLGQPVRVLRGVLRGGRGRGGGRPRARGARRRPVGRQRDTA